MRIKTPSQPPVIDDLNFVLNNLLLPIVITDDHARVRRFNDSWFKMFSKKGDEPSDYINKDYFEILSSLQKRKIYSADIKNRIEEILKKALAGNFKAKFLEVPIEDQWFLNHMHFIHTGNKLHGFIITHHDVSIWKQKELALQSEKTKTAEASQRKMFFLANLNHELKSPLNSIVGFTQLLKEQASAHKNLEGITRLIDNISEAANHLNSIVFRILDMAKIESGTLVLQEEDIFPVKLINSSLNIVHPLFPGRKIEVECICETTVKLRCDKNLAMEVIINLLVNSLKFSDHIVYVKCRYNERRDLVFSVIDMGVGMTEEEVHIALEPFGQNLRSPKDRNTGLGLGVPFCNQVMNLHGGSLKIESQKGKGTIVSATFPKERIIG